MANFSKTTECLSILNDLLRAAGKIQNGQVAHRITLARAELDAASQEKPTAPAEPPVIDLGSSPINGVSYRLAGGCVQSFVGRNWIGSDAFLCADDEGYVMQWVLCQLLKHHGIHDRYKHMALVLSSRVLLLD